MPDRATKTELNQMLQRAGIAPGTADAVLAIDGLLQHWRRRAMKRELGHRALVDLKIDLDLTQLDILAAIEGPGWETEEASGETMVATVAERLAIDPSRASRLVSEMVEAGHARRAVSQADARRTIIELTEQGQSVLDAVRAYKLLIMGDFLSDWAQEDLSMFVPMLRRFSSWMNDIEGTTERHAQDIAQLAEDIASHKRSSETA